MSGSSGARHGVAGMVRLGLVRHGMVGPGKAGVVRRGWAFRGTAR